jgi:hypothetical protein
MLVAALIRRAIGGNRAPDCAFSLIEVRTGLFAFDFFFSATRTQSNVTKPRDSWFRPYANTGDRLDP